MLLGGQRSHRGKRLPVIRLVPRVLEHFAVATTPLASSTNTARLAIPLSPIMSGLNTPYSR